MMCATRPNTHTLVEYVAPDGTKRKNQMRDHYKLIDNPLLDLSPEATTHLFAEMDVIAAELRTHGGYRRDDDQIAFYQLVRVRRPDLTEEKEQWLDLFEVWRLHDEARRNAKAEKDQLRAIALWKERCKLVALRPYMTPAQRAAVDEKLRDIALTLAEITMPDPPEPRNVATWG
jgi:hypothetical protein